MTTIPRNHKRKIADVMERATRCVVRTLRYDFVAKECAPSVAWEELKKYHFARLIEHDDKWTVSIHGNLWYELRET